METIRYIERLPWEGGPEASAKYYSGGLAKDEKGQAV